MKNGNGKKIVRTFEHWSESQVAKAFGLTREDADSALMDWLTVTGAAPEERRAELENLRKILSLRARSWNEMELLSEFIIPVLYMVSFRNLEKAVEGFSQRRLELVTDQYEAGGVVDWMLARGDDEPQKPYFFLHEYKRFKQRTSDPLGQLLIAMLAAQRANNDGLPIYGAWIFGNFWYFILLRGDIYAQSFAYDATKPEALTQIWLILNKTKQIIYDRVDKLIAIGK